MFLSRLAGACDLPDPHSRLGTVSFLNTTTIFGTPTDVTLSELALEMLFPADAATAAIVKAMVDEQTAQSSTDISQQRAS
jgi:hypothetical protein